ncbi:radical SAM protein [Candidatus Fermentibacteria bacterium]|nr:radical SAM protein [Candidatus Fermentibacteria bacterium]
MTDGRVLPPLKLLYVNPAGDCNLRCGHCWVDPECSGLGFECRGPLPGEISPEHLGSILDEAARLGLEGVKFTGGEPLLRTDFPAFHAEAAGRGLRIVVETNGTLEPEGLWDVWSSLPPAFVAVSLDSADPRRHDSLRGTDGAWSRAMGFAGRLREAGVPFQFVMTIGEPDLPAVEAMARLAERSGASSLAVNFQESSGRSRRGFFDSIPADEALEFIRRLDTRFGRNLIPNVPPAFLTLPRLVPLPTCPILNILGVLPDGTASFCGIAFTRPELSMGRLTEKGALGRIWGSHPLLMELRTALTGRRPEPCASCIYGKSCVVHCAMQSYQRTGSFGAPDRLCAEAWSAGLFPESRRIAEQAST